MERRAFERVDTSLPLKYMCDDIQYSGTVNNVSEKGMFISTGNFLPCITSLEIMIPLNNEIASFPVEIRRIEKVNDYSLNIGVELIDPPEIYMQFVNNLKFAIKS